MAFKQAILIKQERFEDYKKLIDLVDMRLSPNEMFSSNQMDIMIKEQIKYIITKFQEES